MRKRVVDQFPVMWAALDAAEGRMTREQRSAYRRTRKRLQSQKLAQKKHI